MFKENFLENILFFLKMDYKPARFLWTPQLYPPSALSYSDDHFNLNSNIAKV